MNKRTGKLEAAMRYVYGHFLEDGESLPAFMASRKVPRPNVRHITRRKLYVRYGCTYKQLARAEASFNGGHVAHESTIGHSIHTSSDTYHRYHKANSTIDRLLLEFDNYYMELAEPDMTDRIRHYYRMPHHVLAAIVGLAAGLGWADAGKLEGLEREFGTVSKKFVEAQIS